VRCDVSAGERLPPQMGVRYPREQDSTVLLGFRTAIGARFLLLLPLQPIADALTGCFTCGCSRSGESRHHTVRIRVVDDQGPLIADDPHSNSIFNAAIIQSHPLISLQAQ
jgi:hypothetical protein